MSCYQGILDYVEAMREANSGEGNRIEDLFRAAVMTAEDIASEEINLAGGCACSELWFHGARKQHLPYAFLQETCVTTTWMRLCEKLLEMTGDPKWADRLERTFYNAYLAAMRPDGSEFAAYTPLTGGRYHGHHHCYMHTDCCTANGPRGFFSFLRTFYRRNGDVATFNFYGSAQTREFEMYSLYPRGDMARIVSHATGPLKLRLRIPGWEGRTDVSVNGEGLEDVVAGSYLTIDRDWKLGDVVEVRFDMPVVVHVQDHHAAFTRGPVLLARDNRFGDGEMAETIRRGEFAGGDVVPAFSAVRTPSDDIWMAFSAILPIGAHCENPEGALPRAVFFCDYASAGNSWRRDDAYRTWIPVEIGPDDK